MSIVEASAAPRRRMSIVEIELSLLSEMQARQ